MDIWDINEGDLESTGLVNALEEINTVSEEVHKSGERESALSAAKEAHKIVASEQGAKVESQTDSDANVANIEAANPASAVKSAEANENTADSFAPHDTNTDTAHDFDIDIDDNFDDGKVEINKIKSHLTKNSQEKYAEVWNLFLENEINCSTEDEKRDLIESKERTSKRSQKFTERPFVLEHKAIKLEREAELNKVAKLATPLSKLKYKFPKPENEAKEEDMCLTDNRTVLEVYGDVIGIVQDKYKPEDVEFLNSCVGYNTLIQQFSSEGVPMPDTILKQLVKEYKEMNDLQQINQAYEKMRGLPVKKKAKKQEFDFASIRLIKGFDLTNEEVDSFLEFVKNEPDALVTKRERQLTRKCFYKRRWGKSIGKGTLAQHVLKMYKSFFRNEKWELQERPSINLLEMGASLQYVDFELETDTGDWLMERFLLDGGATHNILPQKVIEKKKIKLKKIQPRRDLPLNTAGQLIKNSVNSEGLVDLTVTIEGRKYTVEVPFIITNSNLALTQPLLSQSFLKRKGSNNNHENLALSFRAKDEYGHSTKVTIPTVERWEDPSVNIIKVDTKVEEVVSNLGGDGELVDQPAEDLDDEAFEEHDLMEALEGVSAIRTPEWKKGSFVVEDTIKKKLHEINKHYKDCYASAEKQCGQYKHFKVSISVKNDDKGEPMKAIQANRGTDRGLTQFPSVMETMNKLEEQDIIMVSDSQECHSYIHNLLTTPKKPKDSSLRNWTKADQVIQGRIDKLSNKDTPVRVLSDLTTLNFAVKRASITLPDENEVKMFIKDRIISLYDIKNGYFSLVLEEESKEFFNFYWKGLIFTWGRLCQGLCSAPFFFTRAMARMLDDSEWNVVFQLKAEEFKHLFKYAKSFGDITKYYLDDVVMGTPVICHCGGEDKIQCPNGFRCPNLDKKASLEFHLEAHEALLIAVRRAGFLLEISKCQHFCQEAFIFLGTEYSGTTRTYSISADRVQSILSFRVPKSVPELNSRLSSIFYSTPFLPYCKKVALPLTKMVKTGHFVWTRREMESYNNLKVLCALAVSKYFFDPDLHLFIFCDASKWSAAYTVMQLQKTGELELIECETKILNGADSRSSPVQRELSNVLFCITKCSKYLLATRKQAFLIGDAICVLHLKASRLWDSRSGTISLVLSRYPNLNLLYIRGVYLGLVDLLSRGFHNVFIDKKVDYSKTFSEFLPAMPDKLAGRVFKMTNTQLTDYIMSQNKQTHLDLWDKSQICHQQYRNTDIKNLYQECQPVQTLVAWLKNPYDPKYLETESGKQFFGSLCSATKTQIDAFIKHNKLEHLRDALKDLDYSNHWRSIFQSAEEQDKKIQEAMINMVVTRGKKAKGCRHMWETNIECHHWEEAKEGRIQPSKKGIQHFLDDISEFDAIAKKIQEILKILNKSSKSRKLSETVDKYLSLECPVGKYLLFRSLVATFWMLRADDWFQLKKENIVWVPWAEDPEKELQVKEIKGKLTIQLKKNIKLSPLEYVKLSCYIIIFRSDAESATDILPHEGVTVYVHDTVAPYLVIMSVTIFNQTAEEITIKSGSPIVQVRLETEGRESVTTKGVQLQWEHAHPVLDNVYKRGVAASSESLEDMFADYLTTIHVNMIKAAELDNQRSASLKDKRAINKCIKEIAETDDLDIPKSVTNINTKNDAERSRLALSLLLFNNHMRRKGDTLSTQDLISLQNSDSDLVKIIEKVKKGDNSETTSKYRVSHFELTNNILYRVTKQKRHNFDFTYRALCVPKFMAYQIAAKLHNKHTHLNAVDMSALIQKAFYSPSQVEMCKRAGEQCLVCFYSFQPKKRHSRGEQRLHEREGWEVGAIYEVDLLFLSYDHDIRSQTMLCVCDPVSNWFCALPINSKRESSIIKALATLFSCTGSPKILKSDKGSEWISAGVVKFLTQMSIAQHFGNTKNSTSSVEIMIKQYKSILLELLQRYHLPNNKWGKIYAQANLLIQNRPCRKGSFLTRYQVNFSPLRYVNPYFKLIDYEDETGLVGLHRTHYLHNWKGGEKMRLKKKQGVIGVGLETNSYVKNEIPRVDQVSQNQSQQLLPSSTRIFKIVRPLSGKAAAVCRDVLSKVDNVYPATELRPIKFQDWPIDEDLLARNMEDFVDQGNTRKFAKKLFNSIQPEVFMIMLKATYDNPLKSQGIKPILKKCKRLVSPPFKGILNKSKEGRKELQAYKVASKLTREQGSSLPEKMAKLLRQTDTFGELMETCRLPSIERVKATHKRKCSFLLPDNHTDIEANTIYIHNISFDAWNDDVVLCPNAFW